MRRLLSALIGLYTLSTFIPVNAAPSGPIITAGLQLSGSTFESTIADGAYLIEFYSPYCVHCKHFAPEWHDLVESPEATSLTDSFPSFLGFAQVDCVASGDLCEAQKIKGYPSLFLYAPVMRIGEEDEDEMTEIVVKEFKEARDRGSIIAWLKKELAKIEEEQAGAGSATTSAVEVATTEDKVEKKIEPTQVPQIQIRRTPNEKGELLHLTAQQLDDKIDVNSAENGGLSNPLFVEFFAPWCGHCKKLAPTWEKLAGQLQSKVDVASIDCEDESAKAACRKHKIRSFPTLIFFHEGERLEYSGARTLPAMTSFANKVAASHGLRDLTPSAFPTQLATNETFFLYLTPSPQALDSTLDALTRSSLGQFSTFKSTSTSFYTQFHLSPDQMFLLTFKGCAEPYSVRTLSKEDTKSDLGRWMRLNAYPTFGELTAITNDLYLEPRFDEEVLLVLAPSGGAEAKRIAEGLNKDSARRKVWGREVVFASIDTPTWARWLKRMYRYVDDGEQSLILVDPKKLLYWTKDAQGQTIRADEKQLFGTIDQIVKGKLKGKSSRSLIDSFASVVNNKTEGIADFISNNLIMSIILFLSLFGFAVFGLAQLMPDESDSRLLTHKHD